MVIFDTNAILRYILRDNPAMSAEVKNQLLTGEVCFIPVEVIAEIVYVLSKVYGIERDVIATTVTNISRVSNISIAQKDVVLHALRVYAVTTLDFVDCLLIGYAKEEHYTVFTFDKKIRKFLNE
ncbi:MAG: PIN domain-containing protein [Tannerella sp.]|jgi:predicted nucleic-acid-binding protein|nr:PIN domain-containing protein [Tannerella sp.]